MRNKLALVVAIVLGLIAVYGVAHYIGKREKELQGKNQMGRVAAAAEHIPAGTIIEPKMLLREERGGQVVNLGLEIPESAITSQNILVSDEDKLIGLKINKTVERGEVLMVSYFRQPIEKLDNGLLPNQRAITLRVDAITGIAGNIAPDSYVDIIGTFPLGTAGGAKPAVQATGAAASHTRTLLTNVRIIALDNRTRDEDYVSSAGNPRARAYSSVTVNVTPEEANLLVFAQQYGTLTLSLRPPADSTAAIGPAEINEANVLTIADKVEEARQKRQKNQSVIVPTPATP